MRPNITALRGNNGKPAQRLVTLQPISCNGNTICKVAKEASSFFVDQAWQRGRIGKCNQANKADCSINPTSLRVDLGWVNREGPARLIYGHETLVSGDDGTKVYIGPRENLGKKRIDFISAR
ncbi:hypothetical protein P5706_36085 [Pseudomonas sp. ChxA]|uniref:hypothetical protein n=1 Tax=Pseudomonas sp. ChxA TaxID=3035473 RepID=UPI0025560E72|nr:hypothetical protein [Pseudomonas sp. ChxA]MDL2189597.1 hypothetical protein [Pseudomonas sp. ChxA]